MRKELIEKLVEETCIPLTEAGARANLYSPKMNEAVRDGFISEKDREFYLKGTLETGRQAACEAHEHFTTEELKELHAQSQTPLNKKAAEVNLNYLSKMTLSYVMNKIGEIPGMKDNVIYQSAKELTE